MGRGLFQHCGINNGAKKGKEDGRFGWKTRLRGCNGRQPLRPRRNERPKTVRNGHRSVAFGCSWLAPCVTGQKASQQWVDPNPTDAPHGGLPDRPPDSVVSLRKHGDGCSAWIGETDTTGFSFGTIGCSPGGFLAVSRSSPSIRRRAIGWWVSSSPRSFPRATSMGMTSCST